MTAMNTVETSSIRLSDERLAYWAQVPGWRIREATALLLDFDPEFKDLQMEARFRDLHRILMRARAMRLLHSPMKPRFCLQWAISNNIGFSERLNATVAGRDPLRNWKVTARRLRRKLIIAETVSSPPEMDKRQKSTALKFMLAMAEKHYRTGSMTREFDFKKLMAHLTIQGTELLSEKTVRDWLNEAKEEHSDLFRPPAVANKNP